jgi:hypothetical protein
VKPSSKWKCLWGVAIVTAAVVVLLAVKETQARRDAIRGGRPNQVDFSR